MEVIQGITRDFEVCWLDGNGNYINTPTAITIYHYVEAQPAKIIVPNKEPYIITQDISDIIQISTVTNDYSYKLKLDDLYTLGIPKSQFVVPGTNEQVAIQNGYKVFALSAFELKSIINISGSGFTSGSEEGFLTLNSINTGSLEAIQIRDGTINNVLGVLPTQLAWGTDIVIVPDVSSVPMIQMSGKNVYPLKIDESFIINERYFVLYEATDPSTLKPLKYEEDFVVSEKPIQNGLIYSFV